VEVEKTVIRTVEVEKPVTVIKEVVKEVKVPGKTIVVETVKEVVKTVEVPGETVVVEKEVVVEVEKEVVVVREVKVPGETVVITREVVATPTPAPQFGSLYMAEPTISFPIMAPGKLGCTPQDQLHWWSVYDTALYYNFDYPAHWAVGLAESWSYDASLTALTFNIREGIPYHNDWGNVTAEDWKFSFDQQHIAGSLHSNIFVTAEFTKDVVVVDPLTVRHDLTGPNSMYLDKFIGPGGCGAFTLFSKNRIDKLGGLEEAERDISGGQGPYKFVTFDTGNKIVIEAVPEHYRQRANYKRVSIFEIPEAATQVAALMAGEVDITGIPTSEVQRVRDQGLKVLVLKGDGDSHMIAQGRFCYGPLGIKDGKGNTVPERAAYAPEKPWVGDCTDPVSSENARKVREAIGLAIDRQSILDNINGGLGRIPTKAAYMLGPAHDQFAPLHPEWAWPTDVAAARETAKALLAEAGWADGFDIVFRITTGHHPSAVEMGEQIARDLATIGVTADIQVITYAGDRPFKVDRQRSDWWLWAGSGGAPGLAYPKMEAGKLRRVPLGAFNPGFELPEPIALAKVMDTCETQECFDTGRAAMYGWWAENHIMIPVVLSWGAIGVNSEKVGLWPQPTGIPTIANSRSIEYLQKP